MIVRMSFELTDEQRQAISSHRGRKRPATREEVRSLFESTVAVLLSDLVREMEYERGNSTGGR